MSRLKLMISAMTYPLEKKLMRKLENSIPNRNLRNRPSLRLSGTTRHPRKRAVPIKKRRKVRTISIRIMNLARSTMRFTALMGRLSKKWPKEQPSKKKGKPKSNRITFLTLSHSTPNIPRTSSKLPVWTSLSKDLFYPRSIRVSCNHNLRRYPSSS